MRFFSALALALAAPFATASGDGEYEWGGMFEVADFTTIQWIAQKVDGDYADPTMGFTMISTDSGSHGALEGKEEDAGDLLTTASSCTATYMNTTITPSDTQCYKLVFNPNSFETVWDLDVSGVDYVAIFTEHVPTEFEYVTHYLFDGASGVEIEPTHELPEADEADKPFGLVIFACILVNLMTFSGVALLACKVVPGEVSPTTHAGLSGLASGALLACALYLMLVESVYLIGTGTKDDDGEEPWEEVEIVWRWGTAFLGGFLIPLFFFIVDPTILLKKDGGAPASTIGGAPAADESDLGGSTEMVEANGKGEVALSTGDVALNVPASTITQKNMTLLLAIFAGDFFHNLVDGFAIGFAFKMCPDGANTMGWTILAATLYHEIAQEIGDYVLLTHDVGLSMMWALIWNFAAGTSVIIGGLIAVGVDISDVDTGILLAFGGGIYVYLACVEALPRAMKYSEELVNPTAQQIWKHYLMVFASFIFGALAIGLVLINHEHCVPGGGEHAH